MDLNKLNLEGLLPEDKEMVKSVLFKIPEKEIYSTIGVYHNGDKKFNGVAAEHLGQHIKYNITFRYGRALFLEGKCLYRGYLNAETTSKLEKEFEANPHIPEEVSQKYV